MFYEFDGWPTIQTIRNKTRAFTDETEVRKEMEILGGVFRGQIKRELINAASQGLCFLNFKPQNVDSKNIKIAILRLMYEIGDELDQLGYLTVMLPDNSGYCSLNIIWDEAISDLLDEPEEDVDGEEEEDD